MLPTCLTLTPNSAAISRRSTPLRTHRTICRTSCRVSLDCGFSSPTVGWMWMYVFKMERRLPLARSIRQVPSPARQISNRPRSDRGRRTDVQVSLSRADRPSLYICSRSALDIFVFAMLLYFQNEIKTGAAHSYGLIPSPRIGKRTGDKSTVIPQPLRRLPTIRLVLIRSLRSNAARHRRIAFLVPRM